MRKIRPQQAERQPASSTVPYRPPPLKLGSTGSQPVAVKRALWRAGFRAGWGGLDGAAVAAQILGPAAVLHLKEFQRWAALTPDGVYGPATHAELQPWFDDYARLLYTKPDKPPAAYLQLPKTFSPDHPTEGLPGYPAIDVFAAPGATVLAPESGTVTRLSGHDPKEGGPPGGAYGWSIYLSAPGCVYFLTHFATRTVKVGDRVAASGTIGTVCDAAVARMASSASHIHEGKHLE